MFWVCNGVATFAGLCRGSNTDLSNVCHGDEVGKHSGGGDGSASAIALDAHGIFPVAGCGEKDDVVATLEMIERMVLGHLFKTDACFPVFETCHKAEMAPCAFRLLPEGFEMRVHLLHIVPEGFEGAVE